MIVDELSKESLSLFSAEQKNSDTSLVEEAKKISICFVNTSNMTTELSNIQLQGGSGLLPNRLNLNPGESRIFEVFYPLEENENRFRKIVFTYLAMQNNSGGGGWISLMLDVSKNNSIHMSAYHDARYGDRGNYCGSTLRLSAFLKD